MTFNGIKYMRADGSAWGGFAACREGDVGAFPVIAQEDVADQVRAAYEQALDDAYNAMFDIKGDKVTRFDAQTAIRNLKDTTK